MVVVAFAVVVVVAAVVGFAVVVVAFVVVVVAFAVVVVVVVVVVGFAVVVVVVVALLAVGAVVVVGREHHRPVLGAVVEAQAGVNRPHHVVRLAGAAVVAAEHVRIVRRGLRDFRAQRHALADADAGRTIHGLGQRNGRKGRRDAHDRELELARFHLRLSLFQLRVLCHW